MRCLKPEDPCGREAQVRNLQDDIGFRNPKQRVGY